MNGWKSLPWSAIVTLLLAGCTVIAWGATLTQKVQAGQEKMDSVDRHLASIDQQLLEIYRLLLAERGGQ